jgi:hypothetical protein
MERLALADVLCRAVEELVAARTADDDAKLDKLRAALRFLYDVNTTYGGPGDGYAEYYRDAALAQLLTDLLDAIRDWFMGTPWKSDIPSHETIRSRLV